MNDLPLRNKHALVYGAAGSLGTAVAAALAKAGATLHLAGRTLSTVEALKEQIEAAGGRAEAAAVDATREIEVKRFVERVAGEAGSIDVSFCLIDYQVVQNRPLAGMAVEDFVRPVTLAMRSHFLTATAAARVMMKQGSGVILSLTATPGGIGYPFTAGFAPACAAIEAFSRTLASEVGPHGVRVVNIRSGGSPDSQVFRQAIARNPLEMEKALRGMENDTMLKRLPLMEDVANTAVFLASEGARSITGVTVDVTAGTTAALNHRVNRVEGREAPLHPPLSP
jgi:3-oxoacyl-[acyl-carrier protein] reductase